MNQFFLFFVAFSFAFGASGPTIVQRGKEIVAFPNDERGDGELLLVPVPLPQVTSPSSGRHRLGGAITTFLYEVSNEFCNVTLLALLPFRKFQTENLRSWSKSFPLPNNRKTREIDRRSRYKLDTIGTVVNDIFTPATHERKRIFISP